MSIEQTERHIVSGGVKESLRERRRIPSFDELSQPLPLYAPKRWYYEGLSLLLQTLGSMSEGIKTGYTYGFDSGMIMNYVYENNPRGSLYIGRLLDRVFLDQATCKAFRAVKRIVHDVLSGYLDGRNGKPTFIADLASGKADYIYDVLAGGDYGNVELLLRDIDPKALEESRAIALEKGVPNRITYERADALDTAALKRIPVRPDLVVEIGLYGIIHDDGLIRRHLRELVELLDPEALLFNVQTYNPQIELIARALKNREGERCVWHLRPVEALIEWAEEAGFAGPEITMDPYGIYAIVLIKNSRKRSGG